MKIRNNIKNIFTVLALGLAAASCSDDFTDTEWWWGPVEDGDELTEKPRYMWIDAGANFPRFANSQENIAEDLQKAYDAGITDVVVDVRPTEGDVLFKTSAVDQVTKLATWEGGYHFHERTATWDYLQAFIDAGHKIGLRVHAAMNTFTGGHSYAYDLGDMGLAYRDESKKDWFTVLNVEGKLINVMDYDNDSYRTKFFNPANDDVQSFLLTLIGDLAKYNVDGIFLDRCRYNDWASDFSDVSIKKFEDYLGSSVTCDYKSIPETYKKQWIAFRAKVIHDFIEKAAATVKSVNSDIQFGVYVGAWYSTYYECGVNWASPKYNAANQYPAWASIEWNRYGYADHIDYLLLGAYAGADKLYGSSEWTCQGFCQLAKEKLRGEVRFSGGPDVGNGTGWTEGNRPDAVTNSIDACMSTADGYFIFDMVHVRMYNYWEAIKKGVDKYKSTLETK